MTTRTRRGFTLTELLIVIAIIAILAGMLLSAVMMGRKKAEMKTTVQTMKQYGMIVAELYQDDPGWVAGKVGSDLEADAAEMNTIFREKGHIPEGRSVENAWGDAMTFEINPATMEVYMKSTSPDGDISVTMDI